MLAHEHRKIITCAFQHGLRGVQVVGARLRPKIDGTADLRSRWHEKQNSRLILHRQSFTAPTIFNHLLMNSQRFRRPNPAYACYPFLEDNNMLRFDRQDGLSPGTATVRIAAENCAFVFRKTTTTAYEIVLQELPPTERWPSEDDKVLENATKICGNPA